MNVTMLLADAAQIADGKLYVLGGGWSLSGPDPVPSAIAIMIEVEAHEFDRAHHWELFLEDADGHLVQFETSDGVQTIEVRNDFTIDTPEGLPAGTPIAMPIAVNFPPLPLQPDARYTWRLVINGESLPGATVSFSTRPLPAVL